MLPSDKDMNTSRRQFLQRGGAIVAGATVFGSAVPKVYAAEDNTIRLALIGCGGRGTGAVRDALSVPGEGPVQLYAMADLQESKITASHKALQRGFSEKIDVPRDRQFLGFDAYRKAVDVLRPGDVALCTTRAYIRPVHVEYAVSKGINVFMEKPFSPDPAGLQRLLAVGKEADKRGVKVAAGLQCRHSPARQALINKIRDGELGEVQLIRANRLGGARWLPDLGQAAFDLLGQINRCKSHLFWLGSGHMVDNLIHQIDECCWLKDAWPVSVDGMGGRAFNSRDHGQNIDIYSMEFTFADGTKAFCGFRRMNDTRGDFATYVHGTKRAAQFSGRIHAATVHMFKDQRIEPRNIAWTPTADAFRPWQYEWNDFIHSIRNDLPHNETQRAVYSDFASLMGRAACHTGKTVTWDEITNSSFQFCNTLDSLDYDSPVPIKPDENGQFPVPVPGKWTEV
jgi:predicted dehydrogenase